MSKPLCTFLTWICPFLEHSSPLVPRSKGQTHTASSSHTGGASVNTAKRIKVDFLSADGKRRLVGASSSPSLAVLVIFIASYALERFLSECSIAQPSQVTLNLRWQLTPLRPLWITNTAQTAPVKKKDLMSVSLTALHFCSPLTAPRAETPSIPSPHA